MNSIWQELKRRKVIRVAVVYLISAWAVIEVSSVVFPALLLPDWTVRLVVVLSGLGFPIAVALAWAFDLTPDGVEKTPRQVAASPVPAGIPGSEPDEAFKLEDRLDGWKRIAAILNRDVRTVRRWEKQQGLPIRRVVHKTGATVYAYRPELEAWLANRDQMAPGLAGPSSRFSGFPAGRWLWLSVAGLAMTALAYFWLEGKPTAEIEFTDRDWVLITHFDNRSGDEMLDGTLEYALERELNNSRFVKVIARNRVNDALRLMKLPTDTQLDLEIGRQISLRDGAVRILIGGRIDEAGETYSLSVNLVNPTNGVTLVSLSATARGQSEILPAMAGLAREVRQVLGEELASVEPGDLQMSRVTTPSLEALLLYSRADTLMSSGSDRAKALTVLQQALHSDPEFASAHLLLSYLYRDRDELDQASIHLERAMELAETTSERERLFILSSSHSFKPEEYEQAIQISEILTGIFPDHFWAVSNLASLNQVLGRYDEVYRYRMRRADLRPNLGWSNLEAAFAATVFNQPDTRAIYLERVEQLATDNARLQGNLRMLPFYEAWLQGDLQESRSQLDLLVAEVGADELAQHPVLSAPLRSGYLSLGDLETFRQLSSRGTGMGWMEALMEIDSGNPAALDTYLQTSPGHYWDAMLLAQSGRTEEAEAIILDPPRLSEMPWPYYRPNFKYLAQGELALARNEPEEAIILIRKGLVILSPFTLAHYLFALNSLARAQLMTGEVSIAIQTLESGGVEKSWSIFEPGATYQWMRNQGFLVDLYRQAGRDAEAQEASATLKGLLPPG